MCSKSFLSRSVLQVMCLYWATIPQGSQSFLEVRSERLLGENKSGRNHKRHTHPKMFGLARDSL